MDDLLGEVIIKGELFAYMFLDCEDCVLSIETLDDPEAIEFDAAIDECELMCDIADRLDVDEFDVELRYYKD